MFGDPSMQHDPRLEVEPPEDVKDSLTTDERKAAERAYCVSAFDYAEAPVGSRDWTLFWSGWQKRAALSAPATPAKVEDGVWISVVDREPEPMTPVLAAFREEGRSGPRIVRAVWCPAKYANTEEWNFLDDGAEYDDDSDASYWPEGWYEWNETEETHWMMHGDVTHWMPLPAAPFAAEQAKEGK